MFFNKQYCKVLEWKYSNTFQGGFPFSTKMTLDGYHHDLFPPKVILRFLPNKINKWCEIFFENPLKNLQIVMIMMNASHFVWQTTHIDHIKILNAYKIKRILGINSINININNHKHHKFFVQIIHWIIKSG